MTKTSIFSNGHRDEYKGSRPVTAGWMLVRPNGHIESGHSIDRTTAEKTARSHGQLVRTISPREATSLYFIQKARKLGFRNVKAWNDSLKAENAEYLAKCRVEVVDL